MSSEMLDEYTAQSFTGLGFFSVYKAAMLFSLATLINASMVAKMCALFSSSSPCTINYSFQYFNK